MSSQISNDKPSVGSYSAWKDDRTQGMDVVTMVESAVEEEEEDAHRCGKCHQEFASLEEYIMHKMKAHRLKVRYTKSLPNNKRVMVPQLIERTPRPAVRIKKEPMDDHYKEPVKLQYKRVKESHPQENIVARDSYKCTQCPKTFHREAALKRHQEFDHREPSDSEEEDEANKGFHVQAAEAEAEAANSGDEYKLTIATSLRREVHEGCLDHEDRISVCQQCGRAFKDNSVLRAHLLTHTNQRDYKCHWDGCTYAFKTKGSLKRHMRRHTDERPFECKLCHRTFRESGALVRHMKSRTPCTAKADSDLPRYGKKLELYTYDHETPGHPAPLSAADVPPQGETLEIGMAAEVDVADVNALLAETAASGLTLLPEHCNQCKACKAVFVDEGSLREHLKTHLTDLPFRCGLCTFATALRDDLDMHMQVEHRTQLPPTEHREQPHMRVEQPQITVEQPQITVEQSHITVEQSDITVEQPHITVEQPQEAEAEQLLEEEEQLQHQQEEQPQLQEVQIIHQEDGDVNLVMAGEEVMEGEQVIEDVDAHHVVLTDDQHLIEQPMEDDANTTHIQLIHADATDNIHIHSDHQYLIIQDPESTNDAVELDGVTETVTEHSIHDVIEEITEGVDTGELPSTEDTSNLNCDGISSDAVVQVAAEAEAAMATSDATVETCETVEDVQVMASTTDQTDAILQDKKNRDAVIALQQLIDLRDTSETSASSGPDGTAGGSTSKKSFTKCPLCSRCFPNERFMKMHLRSHTGEKSNVCPQCPKAFLTRDALRKHLAAHSEDRQYKCGECGRLFKRISHVREHLKIHTNERPFICHFCSKGFKTSNACKVHIRTHTNYMPWSCQYCRRSFREKGSLERHVRIHTKEKPFSCGHCGRCFAEHGTLNRHLKAKVPCTRQLENPGEGQHYVEAQHVEEGQQQQQQILAEEVTEPSLLAEFSSVVADTQQYIITEQPGEDGQMTTEYVMVSGENAEPIQNIEIVSEEQALAAGLNQHNTEYIFLDQGSNKIAVAMMHQDGVAMVDPETLTMINEAGQAIELLAPGIEGPITVVNTTQEADESIQAIAMVPNHSSEIETVTMEVPMDESDTVQQAMIVADMKEEYAN